MKSKKLCPLNRSVPWGQKSGRREDTPLHNTLHSFEWGSAGSTGPCLLAAPTYGAGSHVAENVKFAGISSMNDYE